MRTTILLVLTVLLQSCGRGPDAGVVPPDSTELVRLARAALDSNRGAPTEIALTVREFRRDSGFVEIVLVPVSATIQGGGGHVRLDSQGRVTFVRGFQ